MSRTNVRSRSWIAPTLSFATVHFLLNAPFEKPGFILSWVRRRRLSAVFHHLYEGDPLPWPKPEDWLVVMGGPMSVHDERKFSWLAKETRTIESAIAGGRRVLGICLGAQLMASALGASVEPNPEKEIGWHEVRRLSGVGKAPLFAGFPGRWMAFHWHGDRFAVPAGGRHLASSLACAEQAFDYGGRAAGLQFHLEVSDSDISRFIAHGGHDLVKGPFIQSPTAMLGRARWIREARRLLGRLLENLAFGRP